MAKKYYGVKRGKTIGIYFTWDDCRAQVEGFPGAQYKSFSALSEAEDYIRGGTSPSGTCASSSGSSGVENPAVARNSEGLSSDLPLLSPEPNSAIAYVDGSFDKRTGHFSYGMVIFAEGERYCVSEFFEDSVLSEMHNVAGEIKGAQAAMQFCLDRGIAKLDLYYDYEGIAKWCLGVWQAKKVGTAAYADYYRSIKDRLRVNFIKVKGHSGDPYNDLADRLAKEALGIK